MSETGTVTASDLRYPIGKFAWPDSISRAEVDNAIDVIAALPGQLRAAVTCLTDMQLDMPYREGGWTIRQVVHHLPDSHMNSYIRFKLALTENEPVITPYDEAAWAKLEDSAGPIDVSLRLLESLHERWVSVMRSMSESDWKRKFVHPERGALQLDVTAALYAWHSRHHLAHVTNLREARGW